MAKQMEEGHRVVKLLTKLEDDGALDSGTC